MAGRPPIREDGHAHVLAVDSGYGQGKTYFLRRLNRHLKATDHVSAFVDAWVDDLEDQPMVALAATLDHALAPWVVKSPAVASGLAIFMEKAGRVAKIAGGGLVKQAAAYVITQGAVAAMSNELSTASDVSKDVAKDALKEAGKELAADLAVVTAETSTPLMEARIARFREGQEAIVAMKNGLKQVVEALAGSGMKLPIVVVVDELDRCRPNYAIKVLEEIKHLFDVPGVAFVLGVHGDQLVTSIAAEYGAAFESKSYLRRFINRRYSLKPADLTLLVQHIVESLGLNPQLMTHPRVQMDRQNSQILAPAKVIAGYMTMYGLSARDAFPLMEALQVAMALTADKPVALLYMLPLLIAQHLNIGELPVAVGEKPWLVEIVNGDTLDPETAVRMLDSAASLDDRALGAAVNAGDWGADVVSNHGFKNGSSEYYLLQNYRKLTVTIARFG